MAYLRCTALFECFVVSSGHHGLGYAALGGPPAAAAWVTGPSSSSSSGMQCILCWAGFLCMFVGRSAAHPPPCRLLHGLFVVLCACMVWKGVSRHMCLAFVGLVITGACCLLHQLTALAPWAWHHGLAFTTVTWLCHNPGGTWGTGPGSGNNDTGELQLLRPTTATMAYYAGPGYALPVCWQVCHPPWQLLHCPPWQLLHCLFVVVQVCMESTERSFVAYVSSLVWGGECW